MQTRHTQRLIRRSSGSAWLLLTSPMLIAQRTTPSRLAPASTPAHQIFDLSVFVIAITGVIFLVVGAAALYRFRARKTDPLGEPVQIDGSTQIELAWTVIPLLIVVVLFLTTLPGPTVRRISEPIFPSSLAHFIQKLFSLLLVWLAKNVTYVGWHIPDAYEFTLPPENWHNFEHICFFTTSFIFWWPIVQPWPARRRVRSGMIIPYLLTSDFVKTDLSAFLCSAGRLLYRNYGVVERPFGIDALKDQIAAGPSYGCSGHWCFSFPPST
jgi:putative membrane protein